jgi:hypothetical protein
MGFAAVYPVLSLSETSQNSKMARLKFESGGGYSCYVKIWGICELHTNLTSIWGKRQKVTNADYILFMILMNESGLDTSTEFVFMQSGVIKADSCLP